MRILKSYLIIMVVTVLFFSCGGGICYSNVEVELPIIVEDSNSQAIYGLECTLFRDGVALDTNISDINGECLLETQNPYRNMGLDEFYSLLTVTIIDTDGTNNGGSFVMQTYQVMDLEDSNGIIIILETE